MTPTPTTPTAATPKDTASWRPVAGVMALCWLAVFFDGMDVNIYGAVMPHMLDDKGFGLTAAVAGTIGSWTTFGMLIGALGCGNLTDWLGRRPVVVFCVVLFSLGSALCAVAPGSGLFGLGRFIAGLGLGGLMPTCLAMALEFAPKGRRALAVGVLMTSYHFGGMLATGLGLWLAPAWGWRWVFWAGVAPAIIAVPLILRYLPESPVVLLAKGRRAEAEEIAARHGLDAPAHTDAPASGAAGRKDAVVALFHPASRWATPLLWVASFCGLMLVYGVSTWLPQLMRASGYGLTDSVTFLMVINAGGIVGMLIAGRTATRFGAVLVSSLWFVVTAAGAVLLGEHLPLGLTYVVVGLTGVFLFSAQSMVYAVVDTVYPAAGRATGLGWTTGVGRLGAVAGPAVGGAVVASGNQGAGFMVFAAAGLVGAVAVGLIPLARRRTSPVVPETEVAAAVR